MLSRPRTSYKALNNVQCPSYLVGFSFYLNTFLPRFRITVILVHMKNKFEAILIMYTLCKFKLTAADVKKFEI